MTRIQEVIEGLQILAPHAGDVCAEHDIIYAGPEGAKLSPQECSRLLELGWHYSDEVDRWAKFV